MVKIPLSVELHSRCCAVQVSDPSMSANEPNYIENSSQTKVYGHEVDNLLDRMLTNLILQPDRDAKWRLKFYDAFTDLKT